MSNPKTPRGRWLNDSRARVTNPFGAPGSGYVLGWHTGVDLAVPGASRVPVVWALNRPGKVTRVAWDDAYGRYVVIRSAAGNEYLLAHLSRVKVSTGQIVVNGQLIGQTGQTGRATGDHLHLERGQGSWRYGSVSRPPIWDYT